MIGIDTNILVRYLVQDAPVQAAIVNKLMARCEDDEDEIWIAQITLCEMVWVLESCYKFSKQEILKVFNALFEITQIKMENSAIVYEALSDYKKHKKSDFADCLIGKNNRVHGCSSTYTFDKGASKLEYFKLLHK